MTELSTPSPNPAHDTGQLPGLTIEERSLLAKMFSDPLSIPPEWKAWLVSYLEANPPVLPISQVHGFSSFTANYAQVSNKQNMPSNGSFVDLATVGPQITELPKGKYVLLFGAAYDASGGATGNMSYSINGAAADYNDGALIEPVNVERFNLMRATIEDLTEDSNTVCAKYYSTQSPGPAFYLRWLLALKYANL